MSVPNVDHAFEALLHTLRAGTGCDWGDTDAPGAQRTDPGVDRPYGVAQLMPGGGTDGDTAQPDGMRSIVVQFTAVAATEKGARALDAKAYQVVLGRGPNGFTMPITPAPPTYVFGRRFDSSGGVDREGPLVNSVARYVLDLHSH
jgi:hypothetical protein